MNLEIRKFAEDKGITRLVHFTRLINLCSILEIGIWPRAQLERHDIKIVVTDPARIDRMKEYNAFSIGQPNRKMFLSVRGREQRLQNIKAHMTDTQLDVTMLKWVVLLVDAILVLEDKQTLFFPDNAAKRGVESGCGIDGLTKLYEGDRKSKPPRFPTNVQSEVLSPRTVKPNLIRIICCETEQDVQIAQKIMDIVKAKKLTKLSYDPEAFIGLARPFHSLDDIQIEHRPEYFNVNAPYPLFTLS